MYLKALINGFSCLDPIFWASNAGFEIWAQLNTHYLSEVNLLSHGEGDPCKGRKHSTRGGNAEVNLSLLCKPGVSGCPWSGLASSGHGAKLWLFHTQVYSTRHHRDSAWKAKDCSLCFHYFFSTSNSSPKTNTVNSYNQNPFPSSITFIMFSIFL